LFLVRLSPTIEALLVLYGTKDALGMAVNGFRSAAVALVAGALFLAQAMEMTGLHKRIALFIMSKVGTKTRNLVLGTIIVSFVLARSEERRVGREIEDGWGGVQGKSG